MPCKTGHFIPYGAVFPVIILRIPIQRLNDPHFISRMDSFYRPSHDYLMLTAQLYSEIHSKHVLFAPAQSPFDSEYAVSLPNVWLRH